MQNLVASIGDTPQESKVTFLYSVEIQSAERAMSEMRTSSRMPSIKSVAAAVPARRRVYAVLGVVAGMVPVNVSVCATLLK